MESTIKTVNIFENFKADGTKSNSSMLDGYLEKKKESQRYKSLYLKCLAIALLTNIFQFILNKNYSEEFTSTVHIEKNKTPVIEIPPGYEKISIKLNTKLIPNKTKTPFIKIAHPVNKKIISQAKLINSNNSTNEAIVAVPIDHISHFINFFDSILVAIPINSKPIQEKVSNEINI